MSNAAVEHGYKFELVVLLILLANKIKVQCDIEYPSINKLPGDINRLEFKAFDLPLIYDTQDPVTGKITTNKKKFNTVNINAYTQTSPGSTYDKLEVFLQNSFISDADSNLLIYNNPINYIKHGVINRHKMASLFSGGDYIVYEINDFIYSASGRTMPPIIYNVIVYILNGLTSSSANSNKYTLLQPIGNYSESEVSSWFELISEINKLLSSYKSMATSSYKEAAKLDSFEKLMKDRENIEKLISYHIITSANKSEKVNLYNINYNNKIKELRDIRCQMINILQPQSFNTFIEDNNISLNLLYQE